MKASTLVNAAGETIAYYCTKCGHIYIDYDLAEKCCTCCDCKMELPDGEFRQCRTCLDLSFEKRRIEVLGKAEDITDSDYKGPVYIEGSHDRYFNDIGDAIEHYLDDDEDAWPEWCHPVEVKKFDMDIWDAINLHCEDQHHEDFVEQMNDMEELQKFWEAWAAKQKGVTWWPDETKKINLGLLISKERTNK